MREVPAQVAVPHFQMKPVDGDAAVAFPGLGAAVFETAGQFAYVYAMSGNGVVAAPIVASYSIVAVLLSRIFLKEKLTKKQYAAVVIVMAGIALMGLAEGLAEG